MFSDDTLKQIKNIVEGIVLEGQGDHCATARNYLCQRYPTSHAVKKDFEGQSIVKKEQAEVLEQLARRLHILLDGPPPAEAYLTRGGEAKVYLANDLRHVIKINDAVYYATWLEFLNSVLLHNLIFENTAYKLVGFIKTHESLEAVLKQSFVISDKLVELSDIKQLLEYNGFRNTRRQDYINPELGLILEDMHDENVIVNSETLFFIDTVFYTITPESA